MKLSRFFVSLLALSSVAWAAKPFVEPEGAAKPPGSPTESDYYKITTFETPENTALEVSSIELLPDHKLVLGTRRGEIWTVASAQGEPEKIKYQLFASGQHEVMGLAVSPKDKSLVITSRYEVARLRDLDGDGRADSF